MRIAFDVVMLQFSADVLIFIYERRKLRRTPENGLRKVSER